MDHLDRQVAAATLIDPFNKDIRWVDRYNSMYYILLNLPNADIWACLLPA